MEAAGGRRRARVAGEHRGAAYIVQEGLVRQAIEQTRRRWRVMGWFIQEDDVRRREKVGVGLDLATTEREETRWARLGS